MIQTNSLIFSFYSSFLTLIHFCIGFHTIVIHCHFLIMLFLPQTVSFTNLTIFFFTFCFCFLIIVILLFIIPINLSIFIFYFLSIFIVLLQSFIILSFLFSIFILDYCTFIFTFSNITLVSGCRL